MGPRELVGRGLAAGQRLFGVTLHGLCRGAAALLGCPGFPRAHALLLGALVALGPILRGRGDPHSVLASPHNRLEARLTSSAAAWTWLLIGSLLVASHPWLRPPWGSALRALARLAVGLALSRAGHALGHALEAATGACTSPTPRGTLLLPLGDPAACRGAGHRWEGFSPAPQAFALVHCGLGLAEEAAALGRSLYGAGKMAAGTKMAAQSKMAAGHKMAAESKMAPWYKMAPWHKMAAGYKMAEESKMAAGWEMAEESKMADEPKMAAGYDVHEESKMAAQPKMAARYKMEEGSKMAAGGGWAWPRPTWRPGGPPPRPIGFEWAEPPHASYGWAGPPPHYGWGGHLGRPYWGGHFDSGGHFEGRTGGHFDSGGHFEGRTGVHFDSGGHFEPGGHFVPPGRHLDPAGRHLDPAGRHFVAASPRFEGGHLAGGHLEGAGGHLEAPPTALSVLYLLAVALLVTWHLLLVVTLTYRHTWARNAAGAALGWAAWALTYRGWYRWAWSPGPPGWG